MEKNNSQPKENHVDCVLLPYQGTLFLLPMVAIADIVTLESLSNNLPNEKKNTPWMGVFYWQSTPIPVLPINFSEKLICSERHHLAVVQSFYKNKYFLPFFGLIFEGQFKRLIIKEKEIGWYKAPRLWQVIVKTKDHNLNATLLPLEKFSNEIEKHWSGFAQI